MASNTDKTLASLSLFSGIGGAFASFTRAQAKRRLGKVNERLAEQQARDVLRRGSELVGISEARTKKTIGSQRAAFAAQGVSVNTGSARDVQADTATVGIMDALAIKNNALREAFGFKVQAINEATQGDLAYYAGITKSFDTLLTSGVKSVGFLK